MTDIAGSIRAASHGTPSVAALSWLGPDDAAGRAIAEMLRPFTGASIDYDAPEAYRVLTVAEAQQELSEFLTVEGTFGENCRLVVPKRMRGLGRIVLKAVNKIVPACDDALIFVANRRPDMQRIVIREDHVRVAIGDVRKGWQFPIAMGRFGGFVAGDGCSAEGASANITDGSVRLGRDCMLSRDIKFYAADGHGVVDLAGGRPALKPYVNDTVIGDHVWIGFDVTVLANARVGSGSIVGAQSCLRGPFGENCVIVGNPAKAVRENTTWSRSPTEIDTDARHYLASAGFPAPVAPGEATLEPAQ